MLDALSRRSMLLTLTTLSLSTSPDDPFGALYTGVRKAVVRSAQIANEADRWQQKLYEDLTLGAPAPPDATPLTLEPKFAKTLLNCGREAFITVRPDASIDALEPPASASALRLLSNSERLAVQQDTASLAAGFAFETLRAWTLYRDALNESNSRTAFNAELGVRLLRALDSSPACASRAERSVESALAEAQQIVRIFEAGGAVRGAKWQGLDLFAEDLADSFSLLLERSAWLDASLRLQAETGSASPANGGGLFYPDPVGSSVAAVLERCAGLKTTRIEYYLDDVYRPDSALPPTQTLIEWSRV
jgi:hypothetical protein